MEVIGAGLEAIGSSISSIATSICFISIAAIGAITFLISTDKASFEEVRDFLKGDRRRR